MSESTALAKALAAQLGDDLDRILGAEPSDAPQIQMADAPPVGLELRQVAGLNSGYTQSLTPGQHQFGAGSGSSAGDARTKPFTLTINKKLDVFLTTEVNVRVDGIVPKKRIQVEREVIDAGSARFVVAPSRPPIRRRGASRVRIASPSEAPSPARIRLADYVGADQSAGRSRRRFGLRSGEAPEPTAEHPLLRRILEARQEWVRYERSRLPDPGQLRQMASADADHRGHVEPTSPEFGLVPIAYGDLPWQPPIDRPDRLPAQLVAAVQQQSVLPSVPLFADLATGHLGIVGDRQASLAVARQIATTLRVLSPFDAITFSLLRSQGAMHDWTWLDELSLGNGTGMPVMFFDGVRQITDHDMRQELMEAGTGGAIVIDDQLHDLPSICATVLEIQPSGAASLLDFRRGSTTTRVATPLGFDAQTTADITKQLRGI